MAIIEKGGVVQEGVSKFVRVGDKIAYGEPYSPGERLKNHKQIAEENDLVEPQSGKPLVDDAGYLRHVTDGKITVAERTTSCKFNWGSLKEDRLYTVALLETLTGFEVKSE